MNKNTLIGLVLLAVAVTVVGVIFPRPLSTQVIRETIEKLGIASGTDSSGCSTINGVTICAVKQAMRTGTTTICALRSPTQASSTLITGFAQFATASTTQALPVNVARSNSPFSTSTGARVVIALASTTLAADLTGLAVSFNATNTYPLEGDSVTNLVQEDRIFGPGEYIVVGLQGGQHPHPTLPTGFCQASWQTFQ